MGRWLCVMCAGGWDRDSLKIKTEGMANRGIFADKKN